MEVLPTKCSPSYLMSSQFEKHEDWERMLALGQAQCSDSSMATHPLYETEYGAVL